MCVPSFARRQSASPATHTLTNNINKELFLASLPLNYGGNTSLTSLFFAAEQQQQQHKQPREHEEQHYQLQEQQQQQQPQKHVQIIAQHDYHDRTSAVGTYGIDLVPASRGGVNTPFPVRLHEMLLQVQHEGLEFIVSWQPHGRCFMVHDPKSFVEVVLSKYFKQSKVASFQRQLNLYGFQRLTKGNDKGGYYNEYFLRGRVDLCSHIHRVKVKGTKVRARSNPDAEPDLWKMNWVTSEGMVQPKPLQMESSNALTGLTPPSSVVSSKPFMLPGPVMSSDSFDLIFFEGKAFHAVESEKLLESSTTVVSQALLDDWNDDDVDSLLGDIEFPTNFHLDIIGALDNDTAFGDLLERLIDE